MGARLRDFCGGAGCEDAAVWRGDMENITSLSVHAAYGLAAVLFVAAAGWRFARAGARGSDAPPELPTGKVPVWIYRPSDLLGLVGVAGVFYLLAVGNAVAGESGKTLSVSLEGLLFSIGFQFFMAAIVVVIVLRRMNPVRWLGLRWRQWPWVFLIAPCTVVTMWAFFAGLQGVGYMDLMDRLGVEKVQDTVAVFQKEQDPLLLILMAFAAAFVAPVCEEVVFRGYLYPAAKRFVGPWLAALCTALIFSAAHGSMAALLPLFVFGLVLVALYEFTGSIWAPVAVHFLFNAATVVVQMLLRFADLPQPPGS
jgi:membrane protease YdiL (CAAX protease family)